MGKKLGTISQQSNQYRCQYFVSVKKYSSKRGILYDIPVHAQAQATHPGEAEYIIHQHSHQICKGQHEAYVSKCRHFPRRLCAPETRSCRSETYFERPLKENPET